MQTKIILKKDVYGLGEEGDVKTVKTGYARNYLLPFSYAVICTEKNIAKLDTERDEINKRKQAKLEASKSIFDKINGLEIHFEENVSEKGKLFGSISQNDILQALKDKGFETEKKYIQLKSPIRELGEQEVNVLFYGNLNAKIKIIITEKGTNSKITENKQNNEDNLLDEESKQNTPSYDLPENTQSSENDINANMNKKKIEPASNNEEAK